MLDGSSRLHELKWLTETVVLLFCAYIIQRRQHHAVEQSVRTDGELTERTGDPEGNGGFSEIYSHAEKNPIDHSEDQQLLLPEEYQPATQVIFLYIWS